MTLEEFIETNPSSYGTGNMNLLYSSSVSGSNNVPIAPFHLQGLSIPFNSKNSVNVTAALKEVQTFRFDYPTGQLTATITGRQQRTNYYYFTFTEIVTNTLPGTLSFSGDPIIEETPSVFVPYVTLNFNNSPYNPLGNNSEGSKTNPYIQKVDRLTSQFNPTNLDSIISGSGTNAELQQSAYTTTGIINGKYHGSKSAGITQVISREYNKQNLTATIAANQVSSDRPAVGLLTFEGSLHASDADTATVKDILNADRTKVEILFESILTGSHPNKFYPNFPKVGNTAFGLEGNRTFKLTNNKIYSIDTDEVLTTNNLGVVTLVE